MSRLLITGADGFVGQWLVRAARLNGHHVIAAIMPGIVPPAEWQGGRMLSPVEVTRADFHEWQAIDRLARLRPEAVVHLAAIASGSAAREDPERAYLVNGTMTALFADLLSKADSPPRFLFISTGEVYGSGHVEPIPESAARNPGSPYAVSKANAELRLEILWRDTGLPAVIARAFPHTGPGQTEAYVLPALAARLRAAKGAGQTAVPTGNLTAIRDFLDVRDVVRAYLLLLERGVPGEVYNVASGVGRRLADCFVALAQLIGVEAHPIEDAALLRPGDIPVLIGDATKLQSATAWSPEIPFERTLQDLVDAQTH